MGIFDFVKDAGSKIFGAEAPEPEARAQKVDLQQLAALKRKKALEKLVAELGLVIEGLEVEVRGDTATVRGKVDDQAEREKVVLAVGNVVGIAHVDDQLEAASSQPEAQFHTVVAGDTLSRIAKKYYGNAGRYQAIFEANYPLLKDPNKIYPGQVLRIPPAD